LAQTLVGIKEVKEAKFPKSEGNGPPGKSRFWACSGSGAAKTAAVAASMAKRVVVWKYIFSGM